MTETTLSTTADASAALNAFVRGIERRAAVFAELLSGDAIAGDAALAATIRAFRGLSTAAQLAEWPWRFWGLLLASPQLRRSPQAGPVRTGGLESLAQLAHGPRAALLLRLVGGLTDDDAARALGVAPPTYRMAVQIALPHRADGTADADAWRAMGEAVQAVARSLPAARLARLAHIRDAALRGQPVRAEVVPATTPAARPRWLWPSLATLAVLVSATLAATFFHTQPAFESDGAPRIRRSALGAADPPASTFDARTALLSHRDLDLLLDEQGEAMARDLDFHAWLAAESAAHAPDSDDAVFGPAGAPAAEPDRTDTQAGQDAGADGVNRDAR